MPNSNVTKGRIVRFVDGNLQEWPAIITVVHKPETVVDLQVFRQVDVIPAAAVPLDSSTGAPWRSAFTWHWPDRN